MAYSWIGGKYEQVKYWIHISFQIYTEYCSLPERYFLRD